MELSDSDMAAINAATQRKGKAQGAYTWEQRIYLAGKAVGIAEERERCARICEEHVKTIMRRKFPKDADEDVMNCIRDEQRGERIAGEMCAVAIRAFKSSP